MSFSDGKILAELYEAYCHDRLDCKPPLVPDARAMFFAGAGSIIQLLSEQARQRKAGNAGARTGAVSALIAVQHEIRDFFNSDEQLALTRVEPLVQPTSD